MALVVLAVSPQVALADSQYKTSGDILDSSFFKPPYFLPLISPESSPETVIQRGVKVPFHTVLYNPSWERPAFRSYWDPVVGGGRWSNLTLRGHYALHRVFASAMNPSTYWDFVHNVGIYDELQGISIRESKDFENQMFVVMQSEVKGVYMMGNQIVITVVPKSTGLHVFTIRTSDIPSIHWKEPTIVQLATQDGQYIDHWMLMNLT